MQQMALGQYRRIFAGLDPDNQDRDIGVHDARRAIKRIRALMRMVRDEVGYLGYRSENVVLRDTSRRLAPVRDSYVSLLTLKGLKKDYRHALAPDAFATTRSFLKSRHRTARQEVLGDQALMTHVRVTLGTACARFTAWDAAGDDPSANPLAARGVRDDFEAIAFGIRRVYRRGRRGMLRAFDEGTTEVFHEWRKRVKYLRYQMEVLEPVWPEMIGAHARSLDRLGELLGDEHDLAVLFDIVRDNDAATADERERTLLLALIYRTRLEFHWNARPLGQSLYAEKPDQFVARLRAYYAAAHLSTDRGHS
jgi:CHAD domain-containing protein